MRAERVDERLRPEDEVAVAASLCGAVLGWTFDVLNPQVGIEEFDPSFLDFGRTENHLGWQDAGILGVEQDASDLAATCQPLRPDALQRTAHQTRVRLDGDVEDGRA
jgi:hypothetical protein